MLTQSEVNDLTDRFTKELDDNGIPFFVIVKGPQDEEIVENQTKGSFLSISKYLIEKSAEILQQNSKPKIIINDNKIE